MIWKIVIIIISVSAVVAAGLGLWQIKGDGLTESTGQNRKENQEVAKVVEQITRADLTETYENAQYGFSFRYPAGLLAQELLDSAESLQAGGDGGMIVLVNNPDLPTSFGFQISIAPFDEPITELTTERIKQDLPDLTIVSSERVALGPYGKGVTFLDGSGDFANRQIWFVAKGQLYQITAQGKYDRFLQKILNTWSFH